jgi:oligopeptide/dipeptide ABC transporter ATP-binding protein
MVPSLKDILPGCTFADRCDFATDQCRQAYPPLEEKRPGHLAACWHADLVASQAPQKTGESVRA